MEERIERMRPLLDERQWRLYLASEAVSAGYGGVSKVSRISGVSRTTITKGIKELDDAQTINGKVRRSGGGRNSVEDKVYTINNNTGFVNVGTSHDTSEFAVESISRWWETVGKHTFAQRRIS